MKGFVFALIATVIWSGNFIVARGVMDWVPPVTLALFRWGTALLFLLPFALQTTLRQKDFILAHWRHLVFVSIIGITLFNTILYVAAHSTSALNLSLIATTSPVFMLVLSRLLYGEAITRRMLLGMVGAVAGVVLLVTKGKLGQLQQLTFAVGDAYMLCASFLFGSYSLAIKRLPAGLTPAALLLTTFTIGTAMLVPLSFWELAQGGEIFWKPVLPFIFIYIGVGASLVAYYCWNRAVALIGPPNAGLIYYTLPLFSGLEAICLLGEPAGWFHFVGGGLIIGGVLLATRQ